MKSKTIQLKLSDEEMEQLKQFADVKERPISWLIRDSLNAYAEKEGLPFRFDKPQWGGIRESKTPGE